MKLTPEQLQQYEQDGYILLKGMLTPEQIELLSRSRLPLHSALLRQSRRRRWHGTSFPLEPPDGYHLRHDCPVGIHRWRGGAGSGW